MFNRINTILIFLLLLSTATIAQSRKLVRANAKYEKMAYMEAARLYEIIIRKDTDNEEVLKKLANSYFKNAKYIEAEKWYAKLFEINKNQDDKCLLEYIHVLKIMGNFNKIEALSNAENGIQGKIDSLRNSAAYFFNFKTDKIKIDVENLEINSAYSDYGASFHNDEFVFASSRKVSSSTKDISLWTNQPFYNLLRTHKQNIKFVKPVEFLKNGSKKFDESSAIFTKDGKTMYFTRNQPLQAKASNKNKAILRLKLFKATYLDGKWQNFQELPFNSNSYNCAHPALSLDEKTLLFVSDMPGSLGASDLFKVSILNNDNYGTPENLGNTINTIGRESYPFISDSNALFFASDGHFGIGGLDIFVTNLSIVENGYEILNIGTPINSAADDFGFYINSANKNGFFSSNREGGFGSDDIYKFTIEPIYETIEEPKEPIVKDILSVTGIVKDAINNGGVPNVTVSVYDVVTNKLVSKVRTNEAGTYSFSLDKINAIRIQFDVDTHIGMQLSKDLSIEKTNVITCTDVVLKPVLDAKVLAKLDKIYFDSNSSYLDKDAELELDKLVKLMTETYPSMVIKIEAHTDPSDSHIYNDWLSEKRAASTYKYLLSRGISKQRIKSYKGYGKRKPINDCTNLKNCTAEEFGLNRRCEFPVVKF